MDFAHDQVLFWMFRASAIAVLAWIVVGIIGLVAKLVTLYECD